MGRPDMTLDTGRSSVFQRYENDVSSSELTAHGVARLLAGVHPRIVADELGVSLRTAYRWRRDVVAVEVVTVDGWTATFVRRQRRPPVRISAWERAA
jgi:hypothetical protein